MCVVWVCAYSNYFVLIGICVFVLKKYVFLYVCVFECVRQFTYNYMII